MPHMKSALLLIFAALSLQAQVTTINPHAWGKTWPFIVLPPVPVVSDLHCDKTNILPPDTSICTVTLSSQSPGGYSVPISADAPATTNPVGSLAIPLGATVGQYTVTFPVVKLVCFLTPSLSNLAVL